jgi:hypothetical protein
VYVGIDDRQAGDVAVNPRAPPVTQVHCIKGS